MKLAPGSRAISSVAAGLWGLHFSFFNPALAFILVAVVKLQPTQMGWVLAASNAGGFIASLVLPAWADRTKRYLPFLVLAGFTTLALVAVLATTTSLPVVVSALVILGGPAGVGTSMLYGHLRAVGTAAREIIHTRTMFSVAWIVGPPLATFIIAGLGDRAILAAIAVVAVVNLVITAIMMRQHQRVVASGAPLKAPDDQLDLPKLVVGLIMFAFLLLGATNNATTSLMNLYVVQSLGLKVWWGGFTLGLAAALEVPFLLALGRLTMRFSSLALVATGAIAGALGYLLMAIATGPVLLLVAQIPNAWFVAATSGVGITLFQQMIPAPGLAAGLMTNTRRLGNIASGSLIAMVLAAGGSYRRIMLICAVLAVAGLAITLLASAVARARSTSAQGGPEPDPAAD